MHRRTPRAIWTLPVAAMAIAIAACTTSTFGEGSAQTQPDRSSTSAATWGGNDDPDPGPALALVDTLTVRIGDDPTIPEYRRAAFGDDWNYDPETECNTRELVLQEESLTPVTPDDSCRPVGGSWRSAYDGLETTDPADLQIDHFIPLSDAWQSGAAAWDDARRNAFANDLDHPESLIAVSSSTNESKGDRSPDEWMPPDRTFWCTYASNWVMLKSSWDLSVTGAEKSTLVQVLSGC